MANLLHPMDSYNKKLLENVHPSDWKNPNPKSKYNLVVLGAGTAGLVTAAICANLGGKVALIEKNLMGGDCLNVGCVPSKCLIHSSRLFADFQSFHDFGIDVTEQVASNFENVMERMRKLRSQISSNDSVKRFSEMGVDVFLGEAHFSSPNTVTVDGCDLNFKKAVIATGARAANPSIDGLEEAGFLTNETVFSLTQLPSEFVVIGGGPIGCEMAQAFHRLGSRVTLIEVGPQFLPREDPDASKILLNTLSQEGISVLLQANVKHVRTSNQKKILELEQNGGTFEISADEILVGIGRSPNVEALQLEKVGVKFNKKYGVEVNDYLQTSNSNIYAAGDVCSRFKFTHTADFAARIVARNALFPFLPKQKFSDLIVPWCTYTAPEIAHVGAYEKELYDKDILFETIKIPFEDVDRAIADGEEEGFVKIHVHNKKGTILGATIVARHAGDMISEITLAMVNQIKLSKIGSVIHPYPTQAEAIRKAADAYNKKKLTPSRKKFLAWMLSKTL